MRILSLLALAALPFAVNAAKKTSGGRFEKYHSRFQSSAPIKLDDSSYEDLTTLPRDYATVVLLTALEARFGCNICRDFQPEWELISKSWAKGDRKGESRVVYGTLDFVDGKASFQKVCYGDHVLEPLDSG